MEVRKNSVTIQLMRTHKQRKIENWSGHQMVYPLINVRTYLRDLREHILVQKLTFKLSYHSCRTEFLDKCNDSEVPMYQINKMQSIQRSRKNRNQ
jgi:hypothetical protein